MRKLLLLFVLLLICVQPVHALEMTAPTVPPSGYYAMPEEPETFSEGFWQIVKATIGAVNPDIREAAGLCMTTLAVTLLFSIVQTVPGSQNKRLDMIASVAVATVLFSCTRSLITLGTDTITEMAEYGKLLLPVMTAALSAQGGITTSAALYTATALFTNVLSAMISRLLVPMVYLYLALAAAGAALGNSMLGKLQDLIKWWTVWCMKTILYLYTGYMGITGVVSGATDAAALKATKLTISGVVPVVGGILSDASEAVLISAGVVKNAAGIYGILAILAICAGPFLRIGIHYLMTKLTAALCGVIGSKGVCALVQDFSAAMGLVLAMTGAECILLLIGLVCFLRGVG